jgi:hypothetical protein
MLDLRSLEVVTDVIVIGSVVVPLAAKAVFWFFAIFYEDALSTHRVYSRLIAGKYAVASASAISPTRTLAASELRMGAPHSP